MTDIEEDDERELISKIINEHIENHDGNKKAAQTKLHNICDKLIKQIKDLENRINKEIEKRFHVEDDRLQIALSNFLVNTLTEDDEISVAIQKAKADLLITQSYDILLHDPPKSENGLDLSKICELKIDNYFSTLEWTDFSKRKPTDISIELTDIGELLLSFTFFSEEEERVLKSLNLQFEVIINMWEKNNSKDTTEMLTKKYVIGEPIYLDEPFFSDTTYCLMMKIKYPKLDTKWSDEIDFITLDFKESCVWRECPDDTDEDIKYSIDEDNSRIATSTNSDYCTLIGTTPLPHDKVTVWNIKILTSLNDNGNGIYIGVAPLSTDQDDYGKNISDACGWYFGCLSSGLLSGPPHNYKWKEYGPRKEEGSYVKEGDSVGVMMDMEKGELSFILNRVNLGVAFAGISVDKPLVPCVILWNEGDSVELDFTDVEENVNCDISTPSNVNAISESWDSVMLTWDNVEDASSYQIEVDGSILCSVITSNSFTKKGLLSDTEHTFRVRTVNDNSVSEWSDAVKIRTQKGTFECCWKECPDDVDKKRKYTINPNNTKIGTKNSNSNNYSTIIGNANLLPNKVTSWSIKLLKSKDNDGAGVYVGVAPFDIDQNTKNYNKCGWYLCCYKSTLCSGLPHNYNHKKYGLKKEKGKFVFAGSNVGVSLNTKKGELSFILNNVNLGVGYDGIPLDKPLVPCVLLEYEGDSVEIDTSDIKESTNSSIPVPSNVTTKCGITWDSVVLTWNINNSEKSISYQIEVNGKITCDITTLTTFTKRGLLADTEYSFRVRAVKDNSVGEWSGSVKGRTQKETFGASWWKECPDSVGEKRKYSTGEISSRTATNVGGYYCTIIGSTPLSSSKKSSWNIKILKSLSNGSNINIGVAPFDIDQNIKNYDRCGWYVHCWNSALCSGPPHNYNGKEYGPRKEKEGGKYVHTGDTVGVEMNTKKGELSFIVSGVNFGVAYEDIPLDKPLVPCVLLGNKGDSVELDFSEVKEVLDSSVPAPSNIAANSNTSDSITLAWDAVKKARFYQIEVDGSKSLEVSTEISFTKIGLLPDTEHCFRVRTVKGDSVSEWSDVVKGKTKEIPAITDVSITNATCDSITLTWDAVEGASLYQIEVDGSKFFDSTAASTFTKGGLFPDTEYSFRIRNLGEGKEGEWSDAVKGRTSHKIDFENIGWKVCSDDVDKNMKYSVSPDTLRIATKIHECYCCTIIGNTSLSLDKVSSWSIKILKSYKNDGGNIFIGVAPSDINQNEDHNYKKCGWYLGCYKSTLFSGPPHDYSGKMYGSRKNFGGYVQTGDIAGVVMDTAKGELSFSVDGINHGVAYEGIPLDKPLVPCVILWWKDDSVELIL